MNKDRILKPYEQNIDCNYVRYSITDMYYGIVYKHPSCNVWYHSDLWTESGMGTGRAKSFSSLEEAMYSLDQKLIDDGFIILTQEQLDKLIILL